MVLRSKFPHIKAVAIVTLAVVALVGTCLLVAFLGMKPGVLVLAETNGLLGLLAAAGSMIFAALAVRVGGFVLAGIWLAYGSWLAFRHFRPVEEEG